MLALALLLSCSDYHLGGDDEAKPGGDKPDRDDTARVDTAADSGGGDGSGADEDSGGDTSDPGEDTSPPVDTAVPDGKIDVVLLMDVAYFYDCYHADLPVRSRELLDALFGSGADVAVAVATYDDYQVSGEWYARDSGLPYALVQQLTTDRSRLDTATGGLSIEWGGDWQGSGYEAIAQAARGKGYDQDCDGRVDTTTDVRPFQAVASDAYGGAVSGSEDPSVPGTGGKPGVGFRDGSKRVIVVFAENGFRSAALGHPVPTGTCGAPAHAGTAATAVTDASAKLLGVNAYEFQDIDPTLQDQLEELATATDSRIDADHDGARDDLAVLSGSWDWPETARLVSAIWQLAEG